MRGNMFSRCSRRETPRSIVESWFEWNFVHLLTPAHLKNSEISLKWVVPQIKAEEFKTAHLKNI